MSVRVVDQHGREGHFGDGTPIGDIMGWSETTPTREELLVARVRELERQAETSRALFWAYICGWTLFMLSWWWTR